MGPVETPSPSISDSASGKKGRGRPRDPGRDRTILLAARQVLATTGYTGASMEAIAKVAGVGKDTLYRRWSSKEALVIDLIDTMARDAVRPKPLDPDPRFNLLLFLKELVKLNQTTDFGPLVAGIVGESSRNPDLAAAFRSFWQRRRTLAAGLIVEVVGHEVGSAQLEILLDRVLGPVYYRLLVTAEPIDESFLWELIVSLPWIDGDADPLLRTDQTAL